MYRKEQLGEDLILEPCDHNPREWVFLESIFGEDRKLSRIVIPGKTKVETFEDPTDSKDDKDYRQNFLNWNLTVAINSYGELFKIGDVVCHEGSEIENETATIKRFEIDAESEEVKAYTDKGHAHIDFFYFPES